MWGECVAQEQDIRDESRVRNTARLGEVASSHVVLVLLSSSCAPLMMAMSYQVDSRAKVGCRDVVHKVAGGGSMSQGREGQEASACLMYRFGAANMQSKNQRGWPLVMGAEEQKCSLL